MATTRSFSAMLNQYLPNSLLKEEVVKRDWILSNCEHDSSWLGGDLIVPFKGATASSVSFGSLTASGDVAEDTFVRGSITSQPEVWGTMVFNHRDIMEHGRVSEQNFLKLLPDTVDDFVGYIKQCVSLSFTNGTSFAEVTDATNAATGLMIVNRPERFEIGQKVSLDDDDTAAADYYVTAVDLNTATVTLSATRGGAAADVSAYSVAQSAKFYFDGSQSNGLTSLKLSLLSSANGGGATLYGETKTAYPYLQAINVDGTAADATNILDTIFDAYTTVKNRGKGNPNKIVMSYKNLGSVMKELEAGKGSYNHKAGSTRVNVYGWTEIDVFGVKGQLTIVGVQEVDDDYIMLLDMRAIKIYSNGMFKKRMSPDGIEYFETRATTGYTYLVDVCFFGDLVLQRPSYCGIIHSISY